MEDKDSYCVWDFGLISIFICDDGAGWRTECGHSYYYPMDDFHFCPFCGRRINVLKPKEEK